MTKTLIDRFTEKIAEPFDAHNDCFEWTAGKAGNGYGVLGLDAPSRKKVYAHRLSYELFVGPIPDGFHIHHLCGNPGCVNPSHLDAITPSDHKSLTAPRPLETHCPQGHPYSEENTYRNKGSRYCRACKRISNYIRKHRKEGK